MTPWAPARSEAPAASSNAEVAIAKQMWRTTFLCSVSPIGFNTAVGRLFRPRFAVRPEESHRGAGASVEAPAKAGAYAENDAALALNWRGAITTFFVESFETRLTALRVFDPLVMPAECKLF